MTLFEFNRKIKLHDFDQPFLLEGCDQSLTEYVLKTSMIRIYNEV